MKKLYDLSKKYPLLVGIVGFAVIFLCFWFSPSPSEEMGIEEVVMKILFTIATTGFIALISGDKILVNSSNKTGQGLLMGLPIIVATIVLIALPVIVYFAERVPLAERWPLKMVWLLFGYLMLGFFEETLFRGLINDAILYQFRDKKGVFVAIALISGFVFGFVHVLGADVHNLVTFAQAALKTINGMLGGFAFLAIYWKTRNILACAIVHGLVDYITVLPITLFSSSSESAGYVLEGESDLGAFTVDTGWALFGTYVIQTVITVIALLVMIKFIKGIDFKKIREEW